MKRKPEPVFKRYDQNQLMLIPPSYDDLVPANHPVRVVNEVIERIDIRSLEASYKGGGTSSYHPRMLAEGGGIRIPAEHLLDAQTGAGGK